jgi:hypothetical protein
MAKRDRHAFWTVYWDSLFPPDSDAAADHLEMRAADPNVPVTPTTVRAFVEKQQ